MTLGVDIGSMIRSPKAGLPGGRRTVDVGTGFHDSSFGDVFKRLYSLPPSGRTFLNFIVAIISQK